MLEDLKELARRFVLARQYNYRKTFAGPTGEEVLKDLARFCRANTSTFHADPRLSAELDGRRLVWLRIQNHLNLSPEDIVRLSTGEG